MTTDSTDPIPRTFEQWRHCIEHWCGIEITPEFIDKRLRALQDTNDYHTRRFIECYGEATVQLSSAGCSVRDRNAITHELSQQIFGAENQNEPYLAGTAGLIRER